MAAAVQVHYMALHLSTTALYLPARALQLFAAALCLPDRAMQLPHGDAYADTTTPHAYTDADAAAANADSAHL